MIWHLRLIISGLLEAAGDLIVGRSRLFGEVAELLDDGKLDDADKLLASLCKQFGTTDRDVIYYGVMLERLRAP